VLGEHGDDLLGADGVAEEGDGLHGSPLRVGGSARRVSRMRTRSSRAARRTRVSSSARLKRSLSLALRLSLADSNSRLPWSAIFSATILASVAESFPLRTSSSRVSSIFSLVMTAAPTPASRVFLMTSSIVRRTYAGVWVLAMAKAREGGGRGGEKGGIFLFPLYLSSGGTTGGGFVS